MTPKAGGQAVLRRLQRIGGTVPEIRALAREIGKDHQLANELWRSGGTSARLLAGMIADPKQVTTSEMEVWVAQISNWGECDGTCFDLWRYTPLAWQKCSEWAQREEEFVKRAAFALAAGLAIKDKKASDEQFTRLLPLIEQAASDDRHYVKKAVNWALRQIGKRNRELNQRAIETAKRVSAQESSAAHWIARDALRELQSEAVKKRLRR